jgi:hypothetical protein
MRWSPDSIMRFCYCCGDGAFHPPSEYFLVEVVAALHPFSEYFLVVVTVALHLFSEYFLDVVAVALYPPMSS